MTWKFFVLIYILMTSVEIDAQMRSFYVYKPENTEGSDAQFSPVTAFLNGGFDVLRIGFGTRKVTEIAYMNGIKNVARNLKDTPRLIREYNQNENRNFWADQVFPLRFSHTSSAWVPNYESHIVGEGLVCRKLAEWFAHRQVPLPYLWAIVTTGSFQYLNEAIENGEYKGDSVDHVADILIFNPLGWALFAYDPVARFFGQTLDGVNWNLQPMINPATGTLVNAGERFMLRYRLPKTQRFKVFYSWGINGIVGVAYQGTRNLTYSYGMGLKASRLRPSIEGSQRVVFPKTMHLDFAFYVDRNGSLLLSASQTGVQDLDVKVNVYPGVFSSFGFYVAYGPVWGVQVGATFRQLPFGFYAGR